MRHDLRKQLTIWVIQGEIAVLMVARRMLIWAMIKTRTRAVVKQAQREHFRNRVEEAMKAHPSHAWIEDMGFTSDTDSDGQHWDLPTPFNEQDWAWDDDQRKWYMKDSRENDPEDDR